MNLTQRHVRTQSAFVRRWELIALMVLAAIGVGCQSGHGSTSVTTVAITTAERVPGSRWASLGTVAGSDPESDGALPASSLPRSTSNRGSVPSGVSESPPNPLDAPPTTAVPLRPDSPRRVPLADGIAYELGGVHREYPATDIFAACGSTVVAPIDGVVTEVRRHDQWVASIDNPATRGGLSITIVGVDGVRYYMSHFRSIAPGIRPHVEVRSGDEVASVGRTGRAGACHIHFGLSPPCPSKEWRVRRGIVDPAPYLQAWAEGRNADPSDDVTAWHQLHRDACADAMAEPTAPES